MGSIKIFPAKVTPLLTTFILSLFSCGIPTPPPTYLIFQWLKTEHLIPKFQTFLLMAEKNKHRPQGYLEIEPEQPYGNTQNLLEALDLISKKN